MASNRTITDSYFRIKERIKKCIQLRSEGHFEFCSLCFDVECCHDVEKDFYPDVLSQLNWWLDIAKRESIQSAESIEVLDLLVPYWPFPYHSVESPGVEYVIRSAYDEDLFGVVNNGDDSAVVDEHGDPVPVKVDLDDPGITWGYILEEGFYPLATFNEGWSVDPILSEGWDESGVIGYWHIPLVESHFDFSRYLVLSREY